MEQLRIGQFMKELRTEKGMTQAVLAEQLNVSDKTVSKWENGKSMPEPALMLPLCEIFSISVSELLNGQRIAPEEYHSKTEETMMKLVKEKENSKKKQYNGLIGVIVLMIIFILSAKVILPQADWIGIFVDIIDILIMLAIDAAVLLFSGYGRDFLNVFYSDNLEKEDVLRSINALELVGKATIYGSLFIFVLALISVLRLMSDPSLLGPQLSMALLGLFYAFIFNLMLLIPIYRLKHKI